MNDFYFIGLMIGLAFYNGIILPIKFPRFFYKVPFSFITSSFLCCALMPSSQKLLGSAPGVSYADRKPYTLTLADVKEAFPQVPLLSFSLSFLADLFVP